jgi:Uma2 family endonuclease
VIEILSPSTGEKDLGIRRSLHAQHGVREYWIVNPDTGAVEVQVLTEAGYAARPASGIFPDRLLSEISRV